MNAKKLFIYLAIASFIIGAIALLFFQNNRDGEKPRSGGTAGDRREEKRIEPPPKPKKHFIQVANCFYESCENMYSTLLRKENQPVVRKSTAKAYEVYKLVSKETCDFEKLNRVMDKIGEKYRELKISFIENEQEAYKLYVGEFANLNQTEMYKVRLEKLFPRKDVALEPVVFRKERKVSKIMAGPYESKEKAIQVLDALKTKKQFRGAFVIPAAFQ